MTGDGLFQAVLNPGERLLWTGRPRRDLAYMLGSLYVLITVEIVRTYRITAPKVGPLPVYLQLELIGLAALFAIYGLFLGRRIWRVFNTAYGVSDRRVFMATGTPKQQKPRLGRLLATGQPEKGSRVRRVSEPERVRELIEMARTGATATAA
jgi:hypothetical protein